jgi:hypothetical protein
LAIQSYSHEENTHPTSPMITRGGSGRTSGGDGRCGDRAAGRYARSERVVTEYLIQEPLPITSAGYIMVLQSLIGF